MADTQKALHTYQGKCLCGDFVFEAKLPEVKTGYGCSCSICHKRGGLWQFPAADDFKFIKGDENNLAIYKFGSRKYSHEVFVYQPLPRHLVSVEILTIDSSSPVPPAALHSSAAR